MSFNKEWFFIINPEAKNGKAKLIWPEIKNILEKESVNFKFQFTRFPMESIDIVKEAIKEGWRNFVAVGGDGTINEVINGVFLQELVKYSEITFAMIPIGTGNDWGKSLGISDNYKEAVAILVNNKIIHHKIGLVEYQTLNMTKQRFLINIAGFGFDASVIEICDTNKSKNKKSKFGYCKTILKQMFKYDATQTTVTIDGTVIFDDLMFSMGVGLGKYKGGGILQLPHARYDSDYLAVTIIPKFSTIGKLICFSKLLRGKIEQAKEVTISKGSVVTIESDPKVGVEVDGEFIGFTKAKISLLHDDLKIISNC